MDVNWVIFLIVVLNALAALWYARKSTSHVSKAGIFIVIIGAGLSYFLFPNYYGMVSLGLWLAVVIAPSVITGRKRAAARASELGYTQHTPITKAIIALNIVAFAIQFFGSATEDPEKLINYGALYSPLLVEGEWWRLLSAQFLHLGLLHIACNMIGLSVLGPFAEEALGWKWYLPAYLICGASGMLIANAPYILHYSHTPMFLVGASAGVLGLVGITAGVLTRWYLWHRSPVAKSQLKSVAQIILLQMIFDSMVPEVSSSAHLGGAAIGYILGLILAPRPESLIPIRRPDGQ